jgi:cytochrome c553
MKITSSAFIAVATLALASLPARADSLVDGSAEAGKAKSITCAACHGAAGSSANAMWLTSRGRMRRISSHN